LPRANGKASSFTRSFLGRDDQVHLLGGRGDRVPVARVVGVMVGVLEDVYELRLPVAERPIERRGPRDGTSPASTRCPARAARPDLVPPCGPAARARAARSAPRTRAAASGAGAASGPRARAQTTCARRSAAAARGAVRRAEGVRARRARRRRPARRRGRGGARDAGSVVAEEEPAREGPTASAAAAAGPAPATTGTPLVRASITASSPARATSLVTRVPSPTTCGLARSRRSRA
jgi:hypothetical protein